MGRMRNDNNLIIKYNDNKTGFKCPYEILLGCRPRIESNLRIFGKIEVVTTKDDIQGKLKNRDTPCMFVGHPVKHSARSFSNNKSRKVWCIIHLREIIWLKSLIWNEILRKRQLLMI